MIGVLKTFWQARRAPKVLVEAEVDHIEIGNDYLILGLNMVWQNETPEEARVEDLQVTLLPGWRSQEPIRFFHQGRFTRKAGEGVIKKIIGTEPFQLPAHHFFDGHLRFLTRAVLDLAEGKYRAEVQGVVAGGIFVHEVELQVTSKCRYRTANEWE